VPVPAARLAGYALLAVVGSLQWVRYVEGASAARAIAWAAAGTATGALVIAARGRGLLLAAAALVGAALALAASGLDLTYLEPRHIDELGDGLARGAEALNTVRLPYLGKEPWVLTTVQLSGAALCWLAALLATWPSTARTRAGALILLLTLSAAPVVSLGADRPALLGLALAAMTAAFLWLERLARRPGLGAAVLAVLVILTAVPLGGAADREQPWFDYKAFSERLSGGTPVDYSWDHDYGPIDWPREGVELFRVDSEKPHYWKAEVLDSFVDDRWTSALHYFPGGDTATDDLPAERRHRDWDVSFRVALRRLRTQTVIGSGTVLDVSDSTRPVEEDVIPGVWTVAAGKELSKGDSYTVRAHVPDPSQQQLAAATVGRDPRRASSLRLRVDFRPNAIDSTPGIKGAPGVADLHQSNVDVLFAPYETGGRPRAEYNQIGVIGSGARALRASRYARTWRLVKRLKADARTPYEYLLDVNAYLRDGGFIYTERPDRPPAGVPPLEAFLFDSKAGYCQQFSGAMALMLRMGGIPARVATGFSPGGQRTSTGEWVVRDTDAHSWVEAWFDGIGWVTFDPTPPATPARSQIAAINAPIAGDATGSSERDPKPSGPGADGPKVGAPLPNGGGASGSADDGVPPWLWALATLAVLVALGLWPRRRRYDAVADLERALRRSRRDSPPGTTLQQLQQRIGAGRDPYLTALQQARYGGGPAPTTRQRAAFRRALARAIGRGGRLRAYWALPPLPPKVRRGPR
jgi:transglutaminase-like putative cysteine protease